MMKIWDFFNDENLYRIWNLTNKIGAFLISFRWQNIGSAQQEAKVAEVKTGNQIDKLKLQMHPDLKSVIQFMFYKR